MSTLSMNETQEISCWKEGFKICYLSISSVPAEDYSKNELCTRNLISTFYYYLIRYRHTKVPSLPQPLSSYILMSGIIRPTCINYFLTCFQKWQLLARPAITTSPDTTSVVIVIVTTGGAVIQILIILVAMVMVIIIIMINCILRQCK